MILRETYCIPGNFRNFAKLLPCHTFYIAHVDHSQKYFLRIFISRKLSDTKISRYTITVGMIADSAVKPTVIVVIVLL